MKRKIPKSGAEIIRPDDPGHSVTFERFSAIVREAGLEKIESTLGFKPPDDGFRHWLLRVLWHFYSNSLPEAGVMFNRNELKKELRCAAELAEKLEISADRIWRSRDIAIAQLQRFGAMFQEWQPPHPSGVAWVGLLREFANTTRLLADTLDDDPGGPRAAIPFDELMIALSDYYRALTRDRGLALCDADYFNFAVSVVDVLRKIERRLPAASFKLPPAKDEAAFLKAIRQRLRRLSAGDGRT
jgi:hypothetical protein